jgi:hypothetical protein
MIKAAIEDAEAVNQIALGAFEEYRSAYILAVFAASLSLCHL